MEFTLRTKWMAVLFGGFSTMMLTSQAGEGWDVKMKPMHFGGLQEFGMIRSGLVSSPIELISKEWVDHFGTFILQEAVINDRLVIKAGLGGIFEFPKPEKAREGFDGTQNKLFFIGPSDAQAIYHFGGVKDGTVSLGGGMFPFQYNPDANNLGEYLFRSGPYPTYLMTGGNGGLTVIGDPYTVLQGFHAKAQLGNLSVDALFITETGLPPLYDWSLGFVTNYKIADGLLELGAGVVFKRIIQVNSKRTVVKELQNSYFQKNGVWYSGEQSNYSNPAAFFSVLADSAFAKNTSADSGLGNQYRTQSLALSAIADSLNITDSKRGLWIDSATGLVPGAAYFTPAGTMLMGRASLDLKKLFPSEYFSSEDLRLYSEIALLGFKNYPVYYKSILGRMPIMVGFNVPTFRFLDLFSVQFEYFNSPNLNNTLPLGQSNWAIPYLPEKTQSIFSQKSYNDLAKKDNFAWSVLLRKRIFSSLSVNAQVARDHLRTLNTDWYYGSRFEPNEVLYKTSSWYWMFQLSWNI
jgi:hypothetical protein